MKITARIQFNKANGQMSINLPKKQMGFLKQPPKEVELRLDKNNFKW